jgi:hypothetical protein
VTYVQGIWDKYKKDKVDNEKHWFQETFSDINNSLGVKCDPKEALSILSAKPREVRYIRYE